MADSNAPRVPLVGIRSRKSAGPDPSATPEIGVALLTAKADLIPGVIGPLEEAGFPFEILVAPASTPPVDPRVREVRADRSGTGELLSRAAEASRADFILPLLPSMSVTAGQIQTLRAAMDSWSAYSYLPGEPAADVALIARPASAVRSAAMYALLGLYAGDLGGPMMIRRSRLVTLRLELDSPASLVEIAVKVKREGGVVRIVTAAAAPHASMSLLSAIRLRASMKKSEARRS